MAAQRQNPAYRPTHPPSTDAADSRQGAVGRHEACALLAKPPVEALALSDVIEAEDHVAVGSELVPPHVRYVLAFNRRPTDRGLEGRLVDGPPRS